ncbi:MAG: CAP domain-containing protein [Patescibacteria group bacterium]
MTPKKNNPDHPLVRATKAIGRHAKDHFVPHQGNGHVPHVLKHHVLLGYSAALVLFKVLAITIAIALPSVDALSSAITPQNVFDLTNRAREKSGIKTLGYSPKLDQAAQAKARDMLERDYFSHFGPDGSTPWSWIVKSGYPYNAAAENLAINFTEAEDVESSWLASPGHRLNILNPKYTEIGVGVAQGMFHDKTAIIVVQMFGLPKTSTYPATKITAPQAVTKNSGAPMANQKNATKGKNKTGRVAGVATEVMEPQSAPTIDIAGADVNLSDGKAVLEIPIEGASLVTMRLGKTLTEMNPSEETDIWKGALVSGEATNGTKGESLSITAIGADGQRSDAAFALVVPNADARDIYALGTEDGADCPLLSGGSWQDIGKSSRCVYGFTILFLGACLGVFMFLGKMKRPIHIAHAALVIALAVLLWNF